MATSRSLDVHLLGGFSVVLGDETLPPIPSRYARLLFSWLALHPDQPHARPVLAARLWSDLDEAKARKRLSQTLWQVQDALAELAPGRSYIHATPETIRFGGAPYRVDVLEFEQALDEVASGDLDGREADALLRRCVDLYRGDLLEGHFDRWVVDEQDRLAQRYADALGRLVTIAKRRSDFSEALTYARRLTHQVPLREDVHREVMRLQVLLGRHSEALQQYERCRAVLAEELGTEPEAATTELANRISETRRTAPPPSGPEHTLTAQRLVGRRGERQRVLDRLDRSLAGRGETVLVEGEPGIGKTRLLAQVGDDARWRGFTVLYGSCDQAANRSPYQAIRDALQPELHPVRVAQLRASLGDQWLGEAARLIPGLVPQNAPRPPELDGSGAADRMRESLVRLTLALTTVAPLALVIDDVQWADDETLQVLRAMAQRHAEHPLLLVLSYRDQEARAAPEVWETLRTIDRYQTPERVELRALSAFETGELIEDAVEAGPVPSSFVAAVHRESGGNPLYAVELLRALRDRGDLRTSDEGLDQLAVPSTSDLHAVIGERVAQIGDDARAVLQLAAVLGAEIDVDALTLAVPSVQGGLAVALDELLRRNLVEGREDGIAFTHAATRQVVLDAIPVEDRPGLHLAAADALEATAPHRSEALAHHLLIADRPARALPHLRRAAERAVQLSAYAAADRLLRQATALLDRVPLTVEDRFALLGEHERVLDVLGHREVQRATLSRMAALVGDDANRRVEHLRRRALLEGMTDGFEDAEDAAREAVAVAADLDDHDRGAALVVLGRVLFWAGRSADAVEVLREAATALDGDVLAEAQARYALGTAQTSVQDLSGAVDTLERARELFTSADDRRGVAETVGALGAVHATQGEVALARQEHEESIRIANEIGYLFRAGVGSVNLAVHLQYHGDPAGSLNAVTAAHELFTTIQNQRGIAISLLNRAWLTHRWLGDEDGAERDAVAAQTLVAAMGNRALAATLSETMAAIARRRGDHDESERLLEQAEQAAVETEEHVAQVQALRGRTELDLVRDRPEHALLHIDRALRIAEDHGIHEQRAELLTLRAECLLGLARVEEALDVVLVAEADERNVSEPHRLHHTAARVREANGDHLGARTSAARAAASLEQALAGLPSDIRERAIRDVPEHAAIAAAGTVRTAELELRMARADAPTGRALTDEDTVPVQLRLPPVGAAADERRAVLLAAVTQARAQGALPTLDDLVDIVGVSRATVRRDLKRLRDDGHPVATRGSRAG